MIDRIKYGWNFRRVVYLLMGGMIVYQGVADKMSFVALFGVYFTAMGLFGFASGYCMPMSEPNYRTRMRTSDTEDIHYDEITTNNK